MAVVVAVASVEALFSNYEEWAHAWGDLSAQSDAELGDESGVPYWHHRSTVLFRVGIEPTTLGSKARAAPLRGIAS